MKNWMEYFRTDQQEVRDEAEQASAEIGKWSAFFMTDGYLDFERWLGAQVRACEVEAGEQSEMLLAVGIRKGLLMVSTHLADLKEQVRKGISDD